jgi:hypothetical protein
MSVGAHSYHFVIANAQTHLTEACALQILLVKGDNNGHSGYQQASGDIKCAMGYFLTGLTFHISKKCVFLMTDDVIWSRK